MEKLVRFLEALKLSHAVEGGTEVARADGDGGRGIGQTVRSFPSSTEQFLEQTAAVASSLSLQGQTLLGGGGGGGGVGGRRETATGKRERMAHCQTVADVVIAAAGGSSSSGGGGRSPDAARLLSVGVETLLLLADDRAPDVRMTADEGLNRIVRGVSSAQVAKVLVEQMKDKLDGSAKVLRAALSRFAVLAKHIRVQKGRAYMQTLVPLLCRLAERPEESVHESVAAALACICPSLCHFATDGELKLLLTTYQANLGHESSVVRRSAAQALLAVCKNARKPALFLGALISLLVKALVPPSAALPRAQVLGCLVCLRYTAPELVLLCPPCADSSVGTDHRSGQPFSVTVNQLLQVYQLSIHYCNSPDHNTVTASLELLRSLLEHAPAALVTALVTPGGVTRCFIDATQPSRTPSCGSISGLLTEEDLSLEQSDVPPGGAVLLAGDSLEEDREGGPTPFMTIQGTTDTVGDGSNELSTQRQGDVTGQDGSPLASADSAEKRDMEKILLQAVADNGEDIYSSIEIGKLSEEDGELTSPGSAAAPPIIPVGEEVEDTQADDQEILDEYDDVGSAPETLMAPKGDIGCGHGPGVCGRHAVRLLCSNFLLAGHSGSLLGGRSVRVSNKVLALACLTRLLTWLPEMMEETLYLRAEGGQGEDELVQRVWDVSYFACHSDPSISAAAATLLGHYLRAVTLNAATHDTFVTVDQHTPPADTLHQTNDSNDGQRKESVHGATLGSNSFGVESVLDQLLEVLGSQSAVAARGALAGLRACLPTLLRCQHQPAVIQILPRLLDATTHPYWLIRVDVCELMCQLPLAHINFMEQNGSCVPPKAKSKIGGQFSERVLREALLPLLPDTDHRVRTAAVAAITRLLPQLALSGDLYSTCVGSLCQAGRLLPVIPANHVAGRSNGSAFPRPIKPFDVLLERLHLLRNSGLEKVPEPATARASGHSVWTEEATKLENLEQCHLDDSLARVVHLLSTTLFTTPDRNMKAGCVQALCQLSQSFPPVLHAASWGCTATVTARSVSVPACHGMVQQVLSFTADPGLTSDLPTLAACTTLACNLLAGVGVAHLRQQPPPPPRHQPAPFAALGSAAVRKTCSRALLHVCRVMLVYWHVLEEVPTTSRTSASHLQAPSLAGDALSPLKRKTRGAEADRGRADPSQITSDGRPAESEKNSGKSGLIYGSFSHLPQYVKLYEVIKSAHNNYKMSVCVLSEQRLSIALRAALSGLCCLLEVLHTGDILPPLEQLLQCCTAATHLLPQQAVQAAQQLVKCLFGSNLAAQWHTIAPSPPPPTQVPTAKVVGTTTTTAASPTHACAVQLPLMQLYREIHHLQHSLFQQVEGTQESPKHPPRRPLHHRPPPSVRPALGSYIRLFEPLVIKALNLYTVSNSVWLQRAVLELLVCLVHIRVNYCLLDSNQIFLRYVIKQLEHIEEGHVRQADVLIPALFSFLVAVSYERQHSRSIITIPKILQLCDGLLASGQPPLSHCVLALGPLVQEVFGSSGQPLDADATPPSHHAGVGPLDVAELATKKEVLACTLLRLAHYHQVVQLAGVMIQGARQHSSQRWLKVSAEVAEVLLPLLANQQINFHSLEAVSGVLEVLCGLCPSVFTPSDAVLRALLTSPAALESTHSVEVWVASVVVVMRLMVTSCSPAALLTRLGELGLSMHYVTAEEVCPSPPAPAPHTPTAFASFSNFSPVRRKLATELRSSVIARKDSTDSLLNKEGFAPADNMPSTNEEAKCSEEQAMKKSFTKATAPTSVTPQPALSDPLNVTQANIKPDTAIARFLLEVLRVCCSEVRSVWYLRCQAGESAPPAALDDDSSQQHHEQDELLLVQLAHQLMLQLLWMADHDEWSVVPTALRVVCSREGDQGGAAVLAEVCECVASVRTAHPSLALLCCQLHAALHLPGLQLWPLVLRSRRRKAAPSGGSSPFSVANGSVSIVGPSGCLPLQYLRETALLLFVPYVTQHLCEEEWLAWVLVQHTSDVVALSDQPAMRHLLHAVHASAAASALLLHALSTRDGLHLHSASQGAAVLTVVSNVHPSQSGTLVIFLLQKVLMRPHFLHLTGTVCSVLRHRLQLLLAPSTEQELQQITPHQLQPFTTNGRWAPSLNSRCPELASELHRLLLRVNSCQGDQQQPVLEQDSEPSTANLSGSDHAWFLRLVAKRCSSAECGGSEECCLLLLQLEQTDLLSVMSAATFSLQLLQHTLKYGLHATLQAFSDRSKSPAPVSAESSPNSNRSNSSNTSSVSTGGSSSSSSGSGSEHPLYSVSRLLLLQHLQRLVAVLPNPYYDYRPGGGNKYSDRVNQVLRDGIVGDEFVEQLVEQLVPACTSYLQSLNQLPWRGHTESSQASTIMRFAMLVAECLQWRLHCGEGSVSLVTTYLELLAVVLLNPGLWARLSVTEHSATMCSLVAGLHCALTHTIAPAPLATLPEALLDCLASSSGGVGVAAGRLMQLIQWLETSDHADLPLHIAAVTRSLVMGLGRWPCLNGVLRCPPVLWTMDWEPALPSLAALPPISPHLLNEPSILKQYIFRAQLLGWLNRQQFEETWMALLSVLNASTTDDTEPQERPYRNQIVCLCVRGLRALLSQTLLLPSPGNPHTARTKQHAAMRSNHASDGGLRRVLHVLQMRQDVVQHLTTPPPFPEPQTLPHQPPSVHVLAAALHSSASPSDGGGPPSPSEAPEHTTQLAAMGIDVSSCTHFLLDLFAAWFAPGKSLCSSVVCEVAKCLFSLVPVLCLGDQQAWLVRTTVALHAAHPLDDHSTHLHLVLTASHALAICRAADVDVGSAGSDGVLHMLQWGLSSTNTGVRTATLHAALLLLQPPPLALTFPASLSTTAHPTAPPTVDATKSRIEGSAMRLFQGSPLPRNAFTALSSHIKTAPDGSSPSSAPQDPFLATLLQLAAPYVLKSCDSRVCDSEAHSLAAWEVCLQLVEQHSDLITDHLPATTALQLALTTAAAHGTTPLLRDKVLLSVQRILAVPLASLRGGSTNEVVLKLVLDLVQRGAPSVCLAALPLLLALLYNSRRSVTEEPDQLLQLMERLGAVMERIRCGLPHEAWLLAGLLGPCLLDLLPASQSLNKVIMEYISSHQPRPQLLAHTLFQVFEGCVQEGGEALVQEWVLMSLGNFSRRSPASLAVWCLTCFLVAASRCRSLRAAFPSVLCWPALLARRALYQPADLRPDQLELFCLAAQQFASALPSHQHKEKFRAVFTEVATPGSPFAVMLQFLDSQSDPLTV